jgi:hypothetical protein
VTAMAIMGAKEAFLITVINILDRFILIFGHVLINSMFEACKYIIDNKGIDSNACYPFKAMVNYYFL